jgi:type II secretory pathway component PulF
MILTVVVPKISVVFSRLRVELPLPTKILIAVSNFLLNYTFFFIGGIVVVAVGFIVLYITNKRLVLGALFSLPLVNRLIKQIELTRFSRNLALLLSSGLPIISALELASDVVSTKELTRTLKVTREMILSGKKFSEGLKTSRRAFPPMVVKIIEAGEKTGTLDKSMSEVAENLDYQVSATLKTLTVAIEPIMLVLVGVMGGGMMLAIIAPIYGLIGQVGPQ